jgi:hypothetical protein
VRLVEGLSGQLAGRWDTPSDDPYHRLVILAGSVSAAARELGVPRRTFRGWLEGRKPRHPPNAIAAIREHRIAQPAHQPHWHDAYTGEKTLAITGRIRVSNDIRIRTIHPGRYIPNAVTRTYLDAWRAGEDDGQVEAMIIQAIDQYYQPVAFENILAVWFE